MTREEAQKKAKEYGNEMIGTFYRHFKGGIYMVSDIAVHSETSELMVVYYNWYGIAKTWVRPLDMFLSPVDKVKYPDADQEMRFELIPEDEESGETE